MEELDELEYLVALADIEQTEILNRQNQHRYDAFEAWSDTEFLKRYRLTKKMAMSLIDLIKPYAARPSRASALNVKTKVLATLQFLAYGNYQENIGQHLNEGLSQASVSRAIAEVTDIMNRREIFSKFVYFPRNFDELHEKCDEFVTKHDFPGVIGCIGCTHVSIYPSQIKDQTHPKHLFVNAKGYHSLNVQFICDARFKILNVLARYPGSSPDLFVWNNSNVRSYMEKLHNRGHTSYILLGNSAYSQRTYLHIPKKKPSSAGEVAYNKKLKSTRSVFERCNKILKLRFRCLLNRMLHYMPDRASKIINACTILHNMCIDNNLPDVPPEAEDENVDFGIIDNSEST